ncbi:T9SS type A sorting domain-containing protein [Pontibacter sp. G13]|uniref:T9SS type A sorting domain-containing protein n=1 Tax=Pontibacter sp. G13 TaxID=3074898 RepID=UPI00288B7A80|nr:T9SS type A sorting domain-containing protein [Pontibacter sp. G13]WNJ20430.1 T9SS type A sorting domain-containing protein [Pontibacter sp. G13]
MRRITFLFACALLCVGIFVHPRTAQAQGTVTIDHKTQRYIDGVSQLDRGKYINFHGFFGNGSTDSDLVSFRNTYNVASTNVGSRRFWSPLNKVDDDAAGTIPSVTDKYNGTRTVDGTVATGKLNSLMHDPNVDYSVTDISQRSLDVAAYIAQSFKDEWDDVPTFYEPLNEPMVHANEFYPQNANSTQTDIIITKICEFYRDMGSALHAVPELSNMQMIGYASAYPQFENNDFDLFTRRYKKYIDIAGADMDGFSLHLYDGVGLNNSGGRRSGSNAEAIMDLVEAYSFEELGVVKPLAITEYGRLVESQPGWVAGGSVSNYEAVENSQALRSQNHMVMSFMERAGNMMISIPFSVGKSNPYNDKFSRAALWIEQTNGSYALTERRYFFEMWKDVQGDRVSINSSNIDVQTQAFVNGNKLYVVLNNLNDATQTVSLNMVDQTGLQTVQTKRLKVFTNAVPQFTTSSSSSAPSSLSIAYGETVVLTYTFGSNVSFTNDINSQKYYATSTLKPITANTDVTFTINGVSKGSGSGTATLRVGVGRNLGANLAPTVKVNGQTVTYSGDVIRGYDQSNRSRFFGILEIPVDMSLLNSGTNTVKVQFPDGGGHVSSVILQVEAYTTPVSGPASGTMATFQNLGSNKFMSSATPTLMNTVTTAGTTEEFEIIDLDGGSLAGGLVALKGSNGLYVSSENGTKEMTCNRATIGAWEQFTFEEISSGVYALKANNAQYLRENMLCTSPTAGSWQQWTVDMTTIASFQNLGSAKYMSSTNPSQMSTVTTLGTTEKFEIIDAGGGLVALKGSNGNYVSSENGTTEMTCNTATIGAWEKFTLEDQGDGSFALLANNGQYLRENMLCTSATVSSWQKWTVTTGLSARRGVEPPVEQSFEVYPNPLNGTAVVVNWEQAQAPYQIQIMDLRGVVVFRTSDVAGSVKIARDDLGGNGVYIVTVNDGKTTQFSKLVVNGR